MLLSCRKYLRYLCAPAGPHVIVTSDRLTITHESEVHRRSDQVTVESQIHTTHREDGTLGNCQNSIHISWVQKITELEEYVNKAVFLPRFHVYLFCVPGISLTGLNKLSRCIIIRDIEPKAMRNGSRDTLTETEWIPTNKVCTISVGVIKSVEEKWSRWAQQILDVLLKSINIFARRVFGNLTNYKIHEIG